MSQWASRGFPPQSLTAGYAINPKAIPSAMENVKGIPSMIKKPGSLHSHPTSGSLSRCQQHGIRGKSRRVARKIVRQHRRLHGKDVGHGQEGGHSCQNFTLHLRAVLLQLKELFHHQGAVFFETWLGELLLRLLILPGQFAPSWFASS